MTQVYISCSNRKEAMAYRYRAVVENIAEARDHAACVVRSLARVRGRKNWRGWVLHVRDDLGGELFVAPFSFMLDKPH
jgi:hypothetical protein